MEDKKRYALVGLIGIVGFLLIGAYFMLPFLAAVISTTSTLAIIGLILFGILYVIYRLIRILMS